ncbi:protein kinase domain protein [Ichthyophthirius multifiliis]|uniref:non-specific serine/threonine protein kinase n=1 Tax=Ichthyophthirius multifiliis TaxID=5932 RepID=G0QUX3_ICHMU|nr:protein kinase domain protein [Ichthyophthirius multifiliis]EGR30978.1 protein kinase domain protein [Ichthyophthirius multifiliis]|eukprot:XP_004034464.1 protein kinase domain protein [Ichthyophthirius multifiliis]
MDLEYEEIQNNYYNDIQLQEQRDLFENPPNENKKISIKDFNLIKVIGKGSYAKVVLVKKKSDGKIYAIKMLKKSYIEHKKQVEHTKIERNILVSATHPFIIKLHYSFQNERKLFFVLEYCPGGELFNLLCKYRRFDEYTTKFYASQIVLALEYLHERNIIYRDLKPENVLIDKEGYLKIADFGLSKKNIHGQTAVSICGTPEYLAPEVLLKKGHGKPVDWWTLGCFIYELITGLPPFYKEDRKQLFECIKYNNFPQIKDSVKASPELKNLISGLLEKNPDQRLGYQSSNQIKQHPFFAKIKWDYLINKQIVAPFIPKIKNELDTKYFDPEFAKLDIQSYGSEINSLENQVKYEGFYIFIQIYLIYCFYFYRFFLLSRITQMIFSFDNKNIMQTIIYIYKLYNLLPKFLLNKQLQNLQFIIIYIIFFTFKKFNLILYIFIKIIYIIIEYIFQKNINIKLRKKYYQNLYQKNNKRKIINIYIYHFFILLIQYKQIFQVKFIIFNPNLNLNICYIFYMIFKHIKNNKIIRIKILNLKTIYFINIFEINKHKQYVQ